MIAKKNKLKERIETIIAVPCTSMRSNLENIFKCNLNFYVVSTYSNVCEIPLVYKPDLLVFESEYEQDFQKIDQLINRHKDMNTIIFSSFKRLSPNFVYTNNNKIGALVYERTNPTELIRIAIDIIVCKNTKTVFHPDSISTILLNRGNSTPILFTSKELKILHYLHLGEKKEEVSKILSIKVLEIEMTCTKMITQLNAKNMLSVILYARAFGFIPLDNERIKSK